MIDFQKWINLIFSLFIEGDKMEFSPLRSENKLFINCFVLRYTYAPT